jgi:hypothetical protein
MTRLFLCDHGGKQEADSTTMIKNIVHGKHNEGKLVTVKKEGNGQEYFQTGQ